MSPNGIRHKADSSQATNSKAKTKAIIAKARYSQGILQGVCFQDQGNVS